MKFDSPRVELGALQWLKVCRLRFATTLDKSEDEPRTQQFNDNPRHARGSYATYYNDSEAARGFLDAFGASGESADHFTSCWKSAKRSYEQEADLPYLCLNHN